MFFFFFSFIDFEAALIWLNFVVYLNYSERLGPCAVSGQCDVNVRLR